MGPGIFPDAQSQFLNSMYGLLSSIVSKSLYKYDNN